MNILQSRLDAEFLLAHMCTVGFKEWIVVLATLLRRTEVRFALLFSLLYTLHILKQYFVFCKYTILPGNTEILCFEQFIGLTRYFQR